jgi:hypothetical protein
LLDEAFLALNSSYLLTGLFLVSTLPFISTGVVTLFLPLLDQKYLRKLVDAALLDVLLLSSAGAAVIGLPLVFRPLALFEMPECVNLTDDGGDWSGSVNGLTTLWKSSDASAWNDLDELFRPFGTWLSTTVTAGATGEGLVTVQFNSDFNASTTFSS